MLFTTIIQHYFLWHYTRAYAELLHVLKNIIWFFVHFFSLPQMAKTLFSPFKRMTEEKHKSWDFEDFAGRIIINFISRIIGAILRGTVLLLGITVLTITILGGAIVYALWFIAPVLIVGAIMAGITLLFL